MQPDILLSTEDLIIKKPFLVPFKWSGVKSLSYVHVQKEDEIVRINKWI